MHCFNVWTAVDLSTNLKQNSVTLTVLGGPCRAEFKEEIIIIKQSNALNLLLHVNAKYI